MTLSSVLHGSEAWTLTSSKLIRIEGAEMKLLRHLAGDKVCGQIRSEVIRKAIKMPPIIGTIETYHNNLHE